MGSELLVPFALRWHFTAFHFTPLQPIKGQLRDLEMLARMCILFAALAETKSPQASSQLAFGSGRDVLISPLACYMLYVAYHTKHLLNLT